MKTTRVAALLVVLALAACSSAPLTIQTASIGPNERILGDVNGSAVGLMLFQIVPIGQNSRFDRAYASALSHTPGATRIVNPTIRENWFWAYLLNGYVFHVSGTAVGPR